MKPDTLLTLDELCARVALSLSVDYDGSPNDRIRDVPDRRTIRYYTTLGLIDRPVVRGRTGLYGRRHLLQLVAIKRLQGHGLALSDIQQRLLGQPDGELAKIARLPKLPDAPPTPDAEEPSPRRAAFWKEPPASPATAAAAEPDRILQALRLPDDLLLLVPLARVPDDADLEAVHAAAAPLLKLLRVRKLIADR
jgi:DNA-binding transcriptional MerR regulator